MVIILFENDGSMMNKVLSEFPYHRNRNDGELSMGDIDVASVVTIDDKSVILTKTNQNVSLYQLAAPNYLIPGQNGSPLEAYKSQ